MRFSNLNLNTKVNKEELLAILRKNREAHSKIVTEAREGYVNQAKAALLVRLEELNNGRIVELSFSLRPPIDSTEVYNTAILMLEMTQDSVIQLEAAEFRNLVQDEWDWSRDFYLSNRNYSAMAARESVTKGYNG